MSNVAIVREAALPEITTTAEFKAKLKYVTFSHVPVSQIPHRLLKKRTGTILHAAPNLSDLVHYLNNCSEEELARKPATRKVSAR